MCGSENTASETGFEQASLVSTPFAREVPLWRVGNKVHFGALAEVAPSSPQRREFILSDVVSVMRAPKKVSENDEMVGRRQRLAQMLGDYYGDGTYARFFDRPGSLKLKERFIVFDLKALSLASD